MAPGWSATAAAAALAATAADRNRSRSRSRRLLFLGGWCWAGGCNQVAFAGSVDGLLLAMAPKQVHYGPWVLYFVAMLDGEPDEPFWYRDLSDDFGEFIRRELWHKDRRWVG